MRCKKYCTETRSTTKNVRYTCIPVEDEMAIRLLKKINRPEIDVLTEVKNMSVDLEETVDVDEKCVPTYNN